ncbi:MAG TPA: hypothetical protein PLY04_17250 [bacterium]|nr:hypothetical protein [bacterium]
MKHRKVTSAIANRMLMLKKEGYTHKYIAKDVGLSDGYISDLFRQRFLLEQMQEKLNTANQSHPGHWPCMIPKREWPRCLHGEHCYLSDRCGAWANSNHKGEPSCGA